MRYVRAYACEKKKNMKCIITHCIVLYLIIRNNLNTLNCEKKYITRKDVNHYTAWIIVHARNHILLTIHDHC